MNKIAISADWHLNHGNILKYSRRDIFLNSADQQALIDNGGKWDDGVWKGDRASKHIISWDSINNMNNTIIEHTNKMLDENDTLFYLGDFLLTQNYLPSTHYFRNQIKCKNIYFIWGNHDRKSLAEVFDKCYDTYLYDQGKICIYMNHYCNVVWPKSHRGSYMAYGHSHSMLEPMMNEKFPNRRSMDVGVDNIFKLKGEYRPIYLEEFLDLLQNKSGSEIQYSTKEE